VITIGGVTERIARRTEQRTTGMRVRPIDGCGTIRGRTRRHLDERITVHTIPGGIAIPITGTSIQRRQLFTLASV
jgi:hypothetical protein